jgi:hypothetical protein
MVTLLNVGEMMKATKDFKKVETMGFEKVHASAGDLGSSPG